MIWKEGTFILPQHFQQQERFFLSELHHQLGQVQSFSWGLAELSIAESDLSFGQFSLLQCEGKFQDGTSFSAPQINKLPVSIKLSDGITNATVYLVLPVCRLNSVEVDLENESNSPTRFVPHDIDIKDSSSYTSENASVVVGEIGYRLAIATEKKPIPDGNMMLPIAKIKEVIGGTIILCDEFIPCLVNASASSKITRFLHEFQGMLSARADSLANRVTDPKRTSGVTEYTDFLLLQLINRIEPLVLQFCSIGRTHPYDLYQFLLSTAGELSTFMKDSRRPINYPIYQHEDLNSCFDIVIEDIETSFKVVLEQVATQIQLSNPKNNIRAARLSHKALLDNGVLVLAVAASIAEEKLRTEFPAQSKIGPGEKIFSLVQSALPGIKISLLSHVPAEIPYRSGYCYFELNKDETLWKELQQSKGLAIHVSGNFPDLSMELWAINRK